MPKEIAGYEASEVDNRIGRFGLGLRNENGNRLVWALVRSTTVPWKLHLHEDGAPQVDLGVTQRHDSRGDRPHTHQPKMVSTRCL
ncbi:hypothetical protein OESDEN_01923 [Oesophagostomum dentatum]|uniref:Uncharacterized protein n=1 Tax=Oesophagostomum dentatum TaxID=61180 RepID=A0A0B1TLH4_OESDE|nr:hypothetical protein OESDEN_01923 [Oesophagostomum dentatum]